jgi:3-oxoacyl-[acyl-carrier-protein] synthase-3
VPHQPNLRLLRRLAKVVGLSADRVHINLDRYGNVSGASCAIALHEVLQRTDLRPGARLLLLTAGAGYTAGAAIVRLPLETS